MKKHQERNLPLRGGRWLQLALLALALLFLISKARALPPDPSMTTKQETLIVTIEEIAPEYRYIFVKERAFRVMPSTVVLDQEGEELPVESLVVPCKAKITFHLFGGNRRPLVTRILLLDGS